MFEHISIFKKLQKIIVSFLENDSKQKEFNILLNDAVAKSSKSNSWFIDKMVRLSLSGIAYMLADNKLEKWTANYTNKNQKEKTIAVINAGNIPMVGFHDFLCVLMSGHKYLGKLSSDDKYLLPAIANILIEIEPKLKNKIRFTTETIQEFDAVIATGSNNTSRYFEYYFGKYPNIIRKNRNGIAIITKNTTDEELKQLCSDIFTYFGLGCRNISKLYIEDGFDMNRIVSATKDYQWLSQHNKYMNNYDYYKSIYLINNICFYDNGFVTIIENKSISSPISVCYYEKFSDINKLITILKQLKEQIQIVVGKQNIDKAIPFGKSQVPELWQYADGVDTMNFLKNLN